MSDQQLLFLPLIKADAKQQTIYARAAVEEPDKAREIMDYATARPQFESWSKQYSDATLGKSQGNVRAMHNPRHLAGKVQELIFDDDGKSVNAVIKILDPVDWHKVEEGGYTGLSIGGGYLKKWADTADPTLKRYTPRIAEISLVDSPCMPSARIMELQKQDGSTAEVLLTGTVRSFADLLPPATFGEVLEKANWSGFASRALGVGRSIGAAARTGGQRTAAFGRRMEPAWRASQNVMGGVKAVRDISATVGAVGGAAGIIEAARHGHRPRKGELDATKAAIIGNLAKAYEGSPADELEDRRGARRRGISLARYEQTKQDRREDEAGERRLAARKQEILDNLEKTIPRMIGGAAVGAIPPVGAYMGARTLYQRADRKPRRGFVQHAVGAGRAVAGAVTGLIPPIGAGYGAIRGYESGSGRARKQEEILGNLEKIVLPLAGGVVGGYLGRRLGTAIGGQAGEAGAKIGRFLGTSAGIGAGAGYGLKLDRERRRYLAAAHSATRGYESGSGARKQEILGNLAKAWDESKHRRSRGRFTRKEAIARGLGGGILGTAVGVPAGFAAAMRNRHPQVALSAALLGAAAGGLAGAKIGEHIGRRLPGSERQLSPNRSLELTDTAASFGAAGTALAGGGLGYYRLKRGKPLIPSSAKLKAAIDASRRGAAGIARATLPLRQRTPQLEPEIAARLGRQGTDRASAIGRLGRRALQLASRFRKQEDAADLLKANLRSAEARAKIKQVMHEHKHGTLRSWRGINPRSGKPRKGPVVQSRRQAIAIALNQARRLGDAAVGHKVEPIGDMLKQMAAPGVGGARAPGNLGGVTMPRSSLTRKPQLQVHLHPRNPILFGLFRNTPEQLLDDLAGLRKLHA